MRTPSAHQSVPFPWPAAVDHLRAHGVCCAEEGVSGGRARTTHALAEAEVGDVDSVAPPVEEDVLRLQVSDR